MSLRSKIISLKSDAPDASADLQTLNSIFSNPEEAGQLFALSERADLPRDEDNFNGRAFLEPSVFSQIENDKCRSIIFETLEGFRNLNDNLIKLAEYESVVSVDDCETGTNAIFAADDKSPRKPSSTPTKIISYTFASARFGMASAYEPWGLAFFDIKDGEVSLRADKKFDFDIFSIFIYRNKLLGANSSGLTVICDGGEIGDTHTIDCKELFFAAPDTSTSPPTLVVVYESRDENIYLARIGEISDSEGLPEKIFEVPLDFIPLEVVLDYFYWKKAKSVLDPYFALDSKGRTWIQGSEQISVYSPDFQLLARARTSSQDVIIHSGRENEVYLCH